MSYASSEDCSRAGRRCWGLVSCPMTSAFASLPSGPELAHLLRARA